MRHPKKTALLLAAILAAASACSTKKPAQSADIDLAGMDKSVAPGDDFNAYANGGWIKSTPIPADKAGYGIDTILTDETRKRTLSLIQDAAKAGASAGADAGKVGDFYATFMDEAAIESKGIAPLKPQLDAFAAIADVHALARVIGGQLRADVDALNSTNFETGNLFGIWITQGLEDPSHTYPYLLQGGLGMPDREYYLSQSPQMAQLRKQYLEHIERMFRLAGFSDAALRATRVFALETAMAGVHATRVESEDVHSAVAWKRTDLPLKAPGLDWPALLEAAGLSEPPVIIVWHPKAVTGLAALVSKQPLDRWKDWLALHAVESAAALLLVDQSLLLERVERLAYCCPRYAEVVAQERLGGQPVSLGPPSRPNLLLQELAQLIMERHRGGPVDFAGGISHDVLLSEQDNPGIASCLDDSSGHNYCQVVSMAALGDRARFPCQV